MFLNLSYSFSPGLETFLSHRSMLILRRRKRHFPLTLIFLILLLVYMCPKETVPGSLTEKKSQQLSRKSVNFQGRTTFALAQAAAEATKKHNQVHISFR